MAFLRSIFVRNVLRLQMFSPFSHLSVSPEALKCRGTYHQQDLSLVPGRQDIAGLLHLYKTAIRQGLSRHLIKYQHVLTFDQSENGKLMDSSILTCQKSRRQQEPFTTRPWESLRSHKRYARTEMDYLPWIVV